MVSDSVYRRSGKCKCPIEELYSMGLIKTSIYPHDVISSKRSRCPMCGGMYSTVISPELLHNK